MTRIGLLVGIAAIFVAAAEFASAGPPPLSLAVFAATGAQPVAGTRSLGWRSSLGASTSSRSVVTRGWAARRCTLVSCATKRAARGPRQSLVAGGFLLVRRARPCLSARSPSHSRAATRRAGLRSSGRSRSDSCQPQRMALGRDARQASEDQSLRPSARVIPEHRPRRAADPRGANGSAAGITADVTGTRL
jgi:hypothetical protein